MGSEFIRPALIALFLVQLIFMDQFDEVHNELITVKGENCIIVKLKDGLKESKVILTNQVTKTPLEVLKAYCKII